MFANNPPRSSRSDLSVFSWLILAFAFIESMVQVYQYHLERWDDAYIVFRYAQHLVEGYGFVWNVGGDRVAGFTSLIDVLLIAAGIKLGIDPWLASLILGVVSVLATAVMMLLIIRRSGTWQPLTIIILSLYLIDSSTAIHAASGLETQLFVALLCGAYLTASAYIESPRWSMTILLAVLVFLSCLTRPEGIIYAIGLYGGLVAFAVRSATGVRQKLTQLAGSTALIIVLGLAYVGWIYHYFGYILPNPYYVKSNKFSLTGLPYVAYFVSHLVLWFAPLVLIGFFLTLSDREPGQPRMARVRSLLIDAWSDLGNPKTLGRSLITLGPPLLALVYYVTILHEVGGAFRFSYPTYFFLVLATGFLLSLLLRGVQITKQRQLAVAIAAGSWIIALLTWQGSWPIRAKPLSGFAQYHIKIAEALKATGLREKGVILGDAAGIIPYVSGFNQVDRIGLVDNFLSGRTALTPEQREAYLWSRQLDVYVGYEPPAEPGKQRPEDDSRMKTPYVSQILMKRKLTLIEPRMFVQDPRLLHARMRELRDNWDLVGELDWPGWGLWRLKSFVYVRRDSPNAAVLMAKLKGIVAVDPQHVDLEDLSSPEVTHFQIASKHSVALL
jgi:hypothetical protein